MRPANLVRLWFVVALNYSVLEASPSFMSNMNYNMYKYDQTVQQFTPDGRLLQIEYAMQAAQHSTPVVLVPLSEKLLLIVTTRRCPRAIKSSSTTTLSSSYLLQERLVLVPTGRLAGTTADAATHLQQQSPQQHAEMVVVALSGVLSDCLSLLEAVQDDRFERQRTFGSDSGSSTAMMVARTIADKCQSHTFGGGVRPFGATLLVCGIQPLNAATKATSHSQENDKDDHSIALYRTDPSGSIQEYSYAALSGKSSSAQQVVIVGGSSLLSRTLERRISSALQEASSSSSVTQQIGCTLRILLEEQTKAEQMGTDKDDPNNTNTEWSVEAVLVSTEKGILKLPEPQIRRLLGQGKSL